MRLGIIGAGGIAQKMAEALANKPHGCECYAVASRSLEKAEAFAKQFYINRCMDLTKNWLAILRWISFISPPLTLIIIHMPVWLLNLMQRHLPLCDRWTR